jgi:hypothetical protein
VLARDLVPGDIVALAIGDRIPADIRLTEVSAPTRPAVGCAVAAPALSSQSRSQPPSSV